LKEGLNKGQYTPMTYKITIVTLINVLHINVKTLKICHCYSFIRKSEINWKVYQQQVNYFEISLELQVEIIKKSAKEIPIIILFIDTRTYG